MITLRDGQARDAERIAGIANETLSDPFISWRNAPLEPDEVLSWTSEGIGRKSLFRVAQGGGDILGFATLGTFKSDPGFERTKELSIYVSSDARGQGVGKALMADVLKPRAGIHRIISAIDASNARSVHMHEGLNFERVGFLAGVGFIAGQSRDLILMMYSASDN